MTVNGRGGKFERVELDSGAIKARALELGFDLCGVAPAAAFGELAFLSEWLDRGYAGNMEYMRRTAHRRADVRHVLPSAQSVIVAAALYNVDRPYSTEVTDPLEAQIARYAWGEDYHGVLEKRLQSLVDWMAERSREPFDARVYVDTGPVQERVYAQQAGIGWIGKNTCIINPAVGSWLLLSEILISLPLQPDPPSDDQCGHCTLCLEACPTEALVEPGVLDARRCLSYLTIELKDSIPSDLREAMGTHVFGCDICQEVCPYNQRPVRTERPEWQPRPGLDRPQLADLWRRSDDELGVLLNASALERTKVRGLRRNLAVALGNAGIDPGRISCDASADRRSVDDPMVAEHVRWAAARVE